jgi:mannose-6-phosphate isomerase
LRDCQENAIASKKSWQIRETRDKLKKGYCLFLKIVVGKYHHKINELILLNYEGKTIMVQTQEILSTKQLISITSNGSSPTECRPWGSFTTLEEGPGYKIKRIEVKPGHRLSLQMHHHRSEHWIVVSGTAKVTCGETEEILFSNQSTYVPQCVNHRLENPGVIPLVLIEVQNGEYLGEDDIVRFQDDYARTESKSK